MIQSNKEDLSLHISKIKKNILKKENKQIKNLGKNYIQYILNLNNNKKSSCKKFYIIVRNCQINKEENNFEIIKQELNEKCLKIKECLLRCGNKVYKIDEKKEISEIFFSFFDAKKYFSERNINKEV